MTLRRSNRKSGSNRVYIEFAGLPGSGKTTLASGLKKGLAKSGHHIMLREEALAACIGRKTDIPFYKLIKKIPPALWRPKPRLPYLFSDFLKTSSANLEFIAFLSQLLADASLDEGERVEPAIHPQWR